LIDEVDSMDIPEQGAYGARHPPYFLYANLKCEFRQSLCTEKSVKTILSFFPVSRCHSVFYAPLPFSLGILDD
jgi:hypothetical protein